MDERVEVISTIYLFESQHVEQAEWACAPAEGRRTVECSGPDHRQHCPQTTLDPERREPARRSDDLAAGVDGRVPNLGECCRHLRAQAARVSTKGRARQPRMFPGQLEVIPHGELDFASAWNHVRVS